MNQADLRSGGDSVGRHDHGWQALEAHLEQVQRAVGACSEQFARVTEQVADSEAAMLERLQQAAAQQVQTDRASLQRERDRLDMLAQELDHRQSDLDRQAQQFAEEQTRLTEAHQQLDHRAAECDSREAELAEARRAVETTRADLARQVRELTVAQRDLDARQQEFTARMRRTISQLRHQEQRREAELKARHDQLRQEQKSLAIQAARQQQRQEQRLVEQQAHIDRQQAALTRQQANAEVRQQELKRAEACHHDQIRQLEQRRSRLKQLRKAMATRREALRREQDSIQTTRRCAKQVLGQRDTVLDMQRVLLEAEHRMILRWGLERSLGWIVRGLLAVLLALAISYLAADKLAKQTWAATAVVQQTVSNQSDRERWTQQQHARIFSDNVMRQMVAHLHQQGPTLAMSAQKLREVLKEDLSLSSPAVGTLVLELRGQDREALTPVLSAAVRAMAGGHSLVAGRVPDGQIMQIAQPPKLVKNPVESNQLTLAATIFGSSVPLLALVGAFAMWAICRAQKPESDALLATAESFTGDEFNLDKILAEPEPAPASPVRASDGDVAAALQTSAQLR